MREPSSSCTLTKVRARSYRRFMSTDWWQHPWLRIELSTRAVLADRLERGPTTTTDYALAQVIAERQSIERAGWFN